MFPFIKAAALLALVLVPSAAEAASCKSLRAKLARAESQGYAKAVVRQRGQLSKTDRLVASFGCRKTGKPRSAECGALRDVRRRMVRNLRQLERSAAPARNRALRKRVKRACRSFEGSKAGIAKAMGGKGGPKKGAAKKVARKDGVAVRRRKLKGTYRTMCVRLCDGFAFPVSLSTRPKRFRVDGEACAAMCPGVKLRLYASPAAKPALENARDAETGEPYAKLATAFRHRERFEPACRCRFTKQAAIDQGTPVREAVKPKRPVEGTAPRVRVVGPDYFAR